MEIVSPKPLPVGTYYFEGLPRKFQLHYYPIHPFVVWEKDEVLKFNFESLILRPLVGRNGKHRAVVMSCRLMTPQ